MKRQKFKIIADLEALETEAGTQVIEETRRFVKLLGK